MSYNKWIAGGLGWAFGGPIGGILGFAIGALYDNVQGVRPDDPNTGYRQAYQQAQQRTQQTTGGDMALSLVVLVAAMMKADGRVTQRELGHVRSFFASQFGAQHAGEMLRLLRDALEREIPLADVCAQIRQSMPHPARLQLMHFLIGLAYADGQLHRAERDLLQRIASNLGISSKDIGSMDAMFHTAAPSSAYQILEVDPKASDDEVKRAYRRMAMKHHPDKVSALGDDMQKAAAEKFKKVQDAYERIQKQRGMK